LETHLCFSIHLLSCAVYLTDPHTLLATERVNISSIDVTEKYPERFFVLNNI
jgi:hypothetical protein